MFRKIVKMLRKVYSRAQAVVRLQRAFETTVLELRSDSMAAQDDHGGS